MRLSDFVAANRAVVPLDAQTLPAAADALLARLVAAGAVSDVAKLRARMEERRPEDLVALSDLAFVLHLRTDAVPEIAVAVGAARVPICRELRDDETQCARLVVLVVAHPRLATTYLQLVGAFARYLRKPERVAELLAQPTGAALAAVATLEEWDLPEQLLVRDLMTPRPRSVEADVPLKQAARDMVRFNIAGLPVVDAEGRLVGMLGQKELLRDLQSRYLQGAAPQPLSQPASQRAVRDVMTRAVLCVSPGQPVAEVASMMTNKDVDRVPVVKDGVLVGLLTRGDIVRKLVGS